MSWKQILKSKFQDFSDKSDKSHPSDPFSHLSHFSPMNQKLKNESVLEGIKKEGASSRWQEYLIERLDILIKFESYSPGQAREAVLAMAKLPFYQGRNPRG